MNSPADLSAVLARHPHLTSHGYTSPTAIGFQQARTALAQDVAGFQAAIAWLRDAPPGRWGSYAARAKIGCTHGATIAGALALGCPTQRRGCCADIVTTRLRAAF
jgi:hypothetical protein